MATRMDLGRFILNVSVAVGTEIALIVGLMIHVFTIAVNVIDWKKAGAMTTSDQIIISIVISKMVLQFIIQLNIFLGTSCEMHYFVFSFLSDFGFDSAVYSFIWLSTLLSVVFYLKVSNLHNVFLLYLKKYISERIWSIITVTVLISVGLSLVNNAIYYKLHFQNSTQFSSSYNKKLDQARAILFLLFNSTPFLICFFTSVLLIIFLCFHTNQMKHNKKSTTLGVYYRTINYTTISVINCALFVTMNILIQDYYCLFGIIFNFVWIAFSTFHSIYTIYANTRLRKWFSKILRHGKNCLIKSKEPNSRAEINTVSP